MGVRSYGGHIQRKSEGVMGMAETNTRIKTGRLMNPKIVEDLLGVIPPEDLRSLNEVEVRLSPGKDEQAKAPWRGSKIQYPAGYYAHSERRIRVHLLSIVSRASGYFGPINNNLYDLMFEEFAKTFYHEAGHHSRNKNGELERFAGELERLKKSDWGLAYRLDREAENAADDYRSRMIKLARKSGLLETPPWKDVPFFKLWHDRFVKQVLGAPKEHRCWHDFVGVCHYIRKCKIGKGVKYSFPELFYKVPGKYPHGASRKLARFKRFVLKHVQPRYYISPTGRKYAYFTDADLERVKAEFLKVKPMSLKITKAGRRGL